MILAPLTIASRVFLIHVLPDGAFSVDLYHWVDVYRDLDGGRNPYTSTTYLNWPPVWMQLIFFLGRLSDAIQQPMHLVVRYFLVLVDVATVYAVYTFVRLELNQRPERIVLFGLVFNPVAILLTTSHGNFDTIVGLFILLGLWMILRWLRTEDPVSWLAGCAFIGLGAVTKTIPLVLAPILAVDMRRLPWQTLFFWAFLLLGPIVYGLSIIFSLAPEGVTQNVLSYRSLGGWFGISGLLHVVGQESLATFIGNLFAPGMLLAMGALAYRIRENKPTSLRLICIALLLPLAIPLLGPGYGPQYAGWVIPVAVITFASSQLRSLLRALLVVASLTCIVEYGLFASHGAYLVRAWPDVFAQLGADLGTRTGQSLVRLPLFLAGVAVFLAGVTRRRQEPI